MKSFDEKIAVVLGASAENGTGWAIAEALAEAGAKVVVGARQMDGLTKLAERIDGTPKACDATSEDQVSALINTAVQTYGRLDIAINAAGGGVRSLIADITPELLERALDLNFRANVYFTRHAAAAMRDGGSIILFSSISASNTWLPLFAYACAKAASDCLVRYAALEYGPRNIRVNSILPGGITSDLGKAFFDIPGVTESFEKEIPLGRLGHPRDFVNAALWLAGPAFTTGLNLQINGGHHLNRLPFIDEMPVGALKPRPPA
jgi:NAD(P)-dependent dehydrogenase (short-subunit alcohol dehydrogenase family)